MPGRMKILIKGTNWIGDAVMSIPAMRRVRAAFPDASVALHTRKWAGGVFADVDFLDEIISFDPSGSRLQTFIEQSRIIRSRSFDAAVLFPNSFESALTIRLAGIPRRFGYRTEGRRFLLTDSLPVPAWKSERHESEFYSRLANFVVKTLNGGDDKSEMLPSLSISDERRLAVLARLVGLGIERDRPIVAIGAGSTNSMAKRWPVEYFAKLCSMLARRFDAQILLIGSAEEVDVGRILSEIVDVRVRDLTGKTDLTAATAVLSIADLFVSNDMGLAHISAALDTPTLTIFGPTNEAATAPLGRNARFIREVVECSPCMLRRCPIDHRCMTRLTPERVFEAAAEILQNRQH